MGKPAEELTVSRVDKIRAEYFEMTHTEKRNHPTVLDGLWLLTMLGKAEEIIRAYRHPPALSAAAVADTDNKAEQWLQLYRR